MLSDSNNKKRIIYTVSEFSNKLKKLVEENFNFVSIKGEISNLSKPSSGHMYFTLKDQEAEMKAVIFKGYNKNLSFNVENGMNVIASGNISVYNLRGYHQLLVKDIKSAGLGSLFIAFEKLKDKLMNEGIFNECYKKKLPKFPFHVGVVTSETGAAIKDIFNILNRRAPHVKLILRPTLVQGINSSTDIVKAIDELDQNHEIEVIILGRGGGSIEDLWSFNEEKVVRKIFQSKTPIISGIGHETDFTLSDSVSDVRAPTPSAAAELISISLDEIEEKIFNFENRFFELLNLKSNNSWQRLDNILSRYGFQKPSLLINNKHNELKELRKQMIKTFKNFLNLKNYNVDSIQSKLKIINPKLILKRGYSIIYDENNSKIIKSIKELRNKENIFINMFDGSIKSQVVKKNNNEQE